MMPPFARLCLTAIAACLVGLGPVQADEVTGFTLDNGMQVVVIEDHRAPVVVHMVWYRVGSADEPPGKSGLAHFTEHLMFKGTEAYPEGAFSDLVELNGGSDNAFTSYDYTGYHQRIAADRLALMMELEADRMTGLTLTEAEVLTERGVILEERNQRTDNSPGALFGEQRSAAQYLNHPYGIPVIGWRAEMEGLSRTDALEFYRAHYAPNNAILIVAGDVEPAQVRDLADRYYGPLAPSAADLTRARPQEPPQIAERRLTLADARVAQPYFIRTYLAPERDTGDQKTAAALVYLAELLGGDGATSLLGQKLTYDEQTALYTSAWYNGTSLDDTTFGFVVVPSEDVSLRQAEDRFDAVLAEFLDVGVDVDLFNSLKMQMRASNIYAADSVAGLAQKYGQALATSLTIQDVQDWPEILDAVTPADVMEAAHALFDRNRSVTGWLVRDEPATKEAAK